MRTFMSRALWGTLFAGGITLLGAAAGAQAAETDGDERLLSGTQAILNVVVPVTVDGLAVSLVGDSNAGSDAAPAPAAPAPAAPAPAAPAPAAPPATSGSDGTASGSQAIVSVSAPVTVSGNSVSVVGDSSSTPSDAAPASAPTSTTGTTSGSDGVLSGTQGIVSIDAPVTVTGNAVSVLGDNNTESTTGETTTPPAQPANATTTGDNGILSGTQLIAPLSAPITITGNAIAVVGDSNTESATSETTTPAAQPANATTTGDHGILSGTHLITPLSAPITVTGNAISVLGDSNTESTTGETTTPAADPANATTTDGDNGILSGTQLIAPLSAPITVTGNAIAVVGDTAVTAPESPTTPDVPVDAEDPAGPGSPGDDATSRGLAVAGSASGVGATASGVGMLAVTGGNVGLTIWALLSLAAIAAGGAVVRIAK